MFNYDYHIHTELCGHAPGQTVEKILMRADELGLESIAITEHISRPDDVRKIDIIRSQVESCQCRCRVLIGAEVDVDREYFDGRLVLENRPDWDYVLGSIHYLPGTNVLPHCNPERPLTSDESVARWQSTLIGLVSRAKIDTLAHPGVMIANVLGENFLLPEVLEIFTKAAIISARNNIAWELNNLVGKKLTESQRRLYYKILQPAEDAGVAFVYGSDSHDVTNIGGTDFVSDVLSNLPNVKNARIREKFRSIDLLETRR